LNPGHGSRGPAGGHEPGRRREPAEDCGPAGGRGPAGREPGPIPLLAGALGMIAAISYSSWVLEVFLSPHIDVFDGYVSELSARDQPYHLVFSAGDFITGVLTIVIATTALVRLRRRPLAVTGWIFLLSFGVWAIGDSVFSMDCAPSIDTGCALRERAGKVSFSHQFHDVTSGMVIFSGIAAIFMLSIAARRYGWWPTLARWGRPLAIAEAGLAIATLVLMLTGQWLGLAQRVQITILCLALFVIAWALLAEEPPPRPARTRRPRPPARQRAIVGTDLGRDLRRGLSPDLGAE
jgi:hypothetical membrane protein